MADKTTVSTNVDTFPDGNSFFVRTEIEARSITIHGPFPDAATAQRLQAEQAAYLKSASEALKQQFQGAAAASPAAKSSR
jgi:hypothetical protein